MTNDQALLEDAARKAGDIALGFFNTAVKTWVKGDQSPVTEADLTVDRFLKETLLDARPDYGWLSEETADTKDRLSKSRVFVVDPIDGTRSFAAGKPDWVISIALVEAGTPVHAAIYHPLSQRLYKAEKGKGAFCDDAPLKARDTGSLETAHFANMNSFVRTRFKQAGLPTPRISPCHAFAYRVCMVASGQVDASVTGRGLAEWDAAAADLILHEAGGRMTDLFGAPLAYNKPEPKHPQLIAAGALHAALQSLLENER